MIAFRSMAWTIAFRTRTSSVGAVLAANVKLAHVDVSVWKAWKPPALICWTFG